MPGYVRHKRNGEVRMDFYTFRVIKLDAIEAVLRSHKHFNRLKPRGGRSYVREFR
jgi:hypothetical protein